MTASVEATGIAVFCVWIVLPVREFHRIWRLHAPRPPLAAGDRGAEPSPDAGTQSARAIAMAQARRMMSRSCRLCIGSMRLVIGLHLRKWLPLIR